MKITVSKISVQKAESDLLIIPIFTDQKPSSSYKNINKILSNSLSKKIKQDDFNGEFGKFIIQDTSGKCAFGTVMLLGFGNKKNLGLDTIYKAASIASKNSKKFATNIALDYQLPLKKRVVSAFIEGFIQGAYEFKKYKTKNKNNSRDINLLIISKDLSEKRVSVELNQAKSLSEAVSLCRDLVNEPPIFLTPTKLAEISAQVSKEGNLEIAVLDKDEIKEKGMEGLLSISRGSVQPPKFIHMKYFKKGSKSGIKKVAIVGKGITFDSGGLCLKPADSMTTMKMDMGGAAVVVGVMKAISFFKPNLEVHGIIPTTENMTGGAAYKPDDVIYAMNGKSIEIINTDAEGRIALSDALSYAVELRVDEIIDLATLTGACMVGLGSYTAGVMGNNQKLVDNILNCSKIVGEKMWQLPLDEELKQEIESPIADVKNVGSRWGGAITAALFLENFVSNTPWVHIDIAGPTYLDKGNKWYPVGASGFGVRTVVEYLLS